MPTLASNPDYLAALAVCALLVLPLLLPLDAWLKSLDTQAAAVKRSARARRLNPTQADAVDAAVARVITEGAEFSGNTIALPCTECGRRRVPPVDVVDSPQLPAELATLIESTGGFRVIATCTACGEPLVSRLLDDEYADYALSIGVVPAIRVDH
jgi:hypothetical protein